MSALGRIDTQTCAQCGTVVRDRTPRWVCPSCGHDNQAKRGVSLGAASKCETSREMAKSVRHLSVVQEPRPQTRADCIDGPRPCPWVGCRYHLALEVTFAGSIKWNFPDVDVSEMKHSCALDMAEAGPATDDMLATLMNVTRARVQQIEYKALAKLKKLVDPEDF